MEQEWKYQLCAGDSCGMVLQVVRGDSSLEYEPRLKCEDCMRCFGFPRIERRWESSLRSEVPAPPLPRIDQQQWLFEVVDQARNGNEEAKDALCEILRTKLKHRIERELEKKGVKSQDWGAAHHDVILRVRDKIEQLLDSGRFSGWLLRIAASIAKQHRVRQQQFSSVHQESPRQRPKQIGTKTVLVDGQQHVVRIFEPYVPPEKARQPVMGPLSDSIIMNWSQDNRPNHSRSIDFRRALAKLPERWALAIRLVYYEGKSRTDAAEIMGCSRNRIYRLHKKARKRLQLLLPGYSLNRKAKLQSRPCEGKPANEPLVEELAAQAKAETWGNPGKDGVDDESWEPFLMKSLWRHASTGPSIEPD